MVARPLTFVRGDLRPAVVVGGGASSGGATHPALVGGGVSSQAQEVFVDWGLLGSSGVGGCVVGEERAAEAATRGGGQGGGGEEGLGLGLGGEVGEGKDKRGQIYDVYSRYPPCHQHSSSSSNNSNSNNLPLPPSSPQGLGVSLVVVCGSRRLLSLACRCRSSLPPLPPCPHPGGARRVAGGVKYEEGVEFLAREAGRGRGGEEEGTKGGGKGVGGGGTQAQTGGRLRLKELAKNKKQKKFKLQNTKARLYKLLWAHNCNTRKVGSIN